MKTKVNNIFPGLITFGFLLGMHLFLFRRIEGCVAGGRAAVYKNAEAATPVTTLSPPEGNTTFIGGTTWCVGLKTAATAELQTALDWACGPGSTDCTAVRPGGACFEPNTVLSHASFAFNSYYQQNGNSDIACNFGGAAVITRSNPSYGSCVYLASEPASSCWSLTRNSHNIGRWLLWYFEAGILLLM
ncbi:Glucan endo-1,3-beta-glucosidase 12 [Platanthera zijinensis]|uniref:Glucan endo-1,3-beta-glucosidase 12 n=1 Tax=Platanthera zijinensis TaxID=2320716 RepID=A0AAP0C1G1_9ASPA